MELKQHDILTLLRISNQKPLTVGEICEAMPAKTRINELSFHLIYLERIDYIKCHTPVTPRDEFRYSITTSGINAIEPWGGNHNGR